MKDKNDPINVLTPKFRTKEIMAEIEECLEKGWSGMGFKTNRFEDEWGEYTGLKYSHFISSNTVGLHLALKILKISEGWNDGDEIITTPLTFVSTNHAILYENLTPVFADVDEFLCLDPKSVEERITEKTRAVMFVGIGGNTGRLDIIREICEAKKIKLILDAAHMAGTFVNSENPVHVGQEADIVVFSFHSVKNLPTADSGMICFCNPVHLELAKKLTWLGIDKDTYSRTSTKGRYLWKYDVPYLGYKYHGNSIMASIGIVQLKYLDEDNDRRNEMAKIYDVLLADVDGVIPIRTAPYCYKSSKHLCQVLVDSQIRDDLLVHFYENNIFPGVHYLDNTNYPMYNFASGTCPNARNFSERLISLPLHLNLESSDIQRVVEVFSDYFNK